MRGEAPAEESATDARAETPTADPGCFDSLAPPQPLDADTKKALAALLTPEQFQALADITGQGGPDVEVIANSAGRA